MDADALAYMYEDALDLVLQLEAWAGIEAGAYEDAGTIWTRRLILTAQIVGLILLLGISAVSAFVLSKAVLPSSADPLPLSSVDTSPKNTAMYRATCRRWLAHARRRRQQCRRLGEIQARRGRLAW